MGGEFVQVDGVAAADADVGYVALDGLGLVHQDDVEAGIGLVQGRFQLDRVVVAPRGPPDDPPLEGQDALLRVAFDGVVLRIKPDSGGSHGSSVLLGGRGYMMMMIFGSDSDSKTMSCGCRPSSRFLVGGMSYDLYIQETRRICFNKPRVFMC